LPKEITHGGVTYKLKYINPCFRFSRYKAGGFFRTHRDGKNYDNTVNPEEHTENVLTLNIFLNDDFDGGETTFFEVNKFTLKPVAGMAGLFMHNQLHCGERVKDHRKYLLRTDVMGLDVNKQAVRSHPAVMFDLDKINPGDNILVCGVNAGHITRHLLRYLRHQYEHVVLVSDNPVDNYNNDVIETYDKHPFYVSAPHTLIVLYEPPQRVMWSKYPNTGFILQKTSTEHPRKIQYYDIDYIFYTHILTGEFLTNFRYWYRNVDGVYTKLESLEGDPNGALVKSVKEHHFAPFCIECITFPDLELLLCMAQVAANLDVGDIYINVGVSL